jgi:hypothetical protein
VASFPERVLRDWGKDTSTITRNTNAPVAILMPDDIVPTNLFLERFVL